MSKCRIVVLAAALSLVLSGNVEGTDASPWSRPSLHLQALVGSGLGLGVEGRMKALGVRLGAYTAGGGDVDLVLGFEVGLVVYPFALAKGVRAQPFVCLSVGSAGGEDVQGGDAYAYGVGVILGSRGRIGALFQMRRMHIDFFPDTGIETVHHVVGGITVRL